MNKGKGAFRWDSQSKAAAPVTYVEAWQSSVAMEWAKTLLDKAPDSLKQQYIQLKDEAESTASDMVKKIESDFHMAKADLDGLAAGGKKGAGHKEASLPADMEGAAASSAGAWAAAPGDEIREHTVKFGCTEVAATAHEQNAPAEALNADPQPWTRFFPSFIGGPIERIGKYMRGELDFKGLGICNCFVGPTVADKDQMHQKSKSAYGLGVCVCCVGGEKTKEEESDIRKNIEEKLQSTHYGSGSSSRLLTSSAADVLNLYRREGRTTQAGARARAEARVQRILALQERAEGRTARLNDRLTKTAKDGESLIESQAKDLLAKAQERRRLDMENDKAAGEMPLSLKIAL